jgi:hypothetical protein
VRGRSAPEAGGVSPVPSTRSSRLAAQRE